MSNFPESAPSGAASNRHRIGADEPVVRRTSESAPETAVQGRRALIALAIGAIGTVAFVIGLRVALAKLPPEGAATRPAIADSARAARTPRPTPPPTNTPDEYPRLR